MDHSARPTSSWSIPRSRSDRDQSPPSGASELLSSAIDALQNDACDLTSRIVELLRNTAQATGNYAIVQQLREDRRKFWIQIEELECKCLPVPRETPPAIEIELMLGPDALMPPLPPLVHYGRMPYPAHRAHAAIYEPIFARFSQPQKAEPMHEIARTTGVPLTTLYNWKKHYCPDSQWRQGHPTPGSRRIFTDHEAPEITDHIRSHYLSKHLLLTMSNKRALILKWYQAHLQHAPRDWEATVPIRYRKFHCVRHFLRDCMTRNHLSYRCVRAAGRCEVRPDEVERFQRELLAVYRDFPRSHIVNTDESMWLVLWQPRKTLAEKGVESVKIEVSGDPKLDSRSLALSQRAVSGCRYFWLRKASRQSSICISARISLRWLTVRKVDGLINMSFCAFSCSFVRIEEHDQSLCCWTNTQRTELLCFISEPTNSVLS
jgi:hypothetical protein